MDAEISYFSAASLAALAIFLVFTIPRALWHLLRAAGRALGRKDTSVDPWLAAIGVSTLVCAGLAAAVAWRPRWRSTATAPSICSTRRPP